MGDGDSLAHALSPMGSERLSATVMERLRGLILNGTWAAGSRLPSEHELASALGVSRGTIREALNNLEAGGLITSRPGLGTFVRKRSGILRNNLNINSSLTRLIESMGLIPGCREVSCRFEPASESVADALNLPVRAHTCVVERLRTASDQPVALTVDIFSYQLLTAAERPITPQELEHLLLTENSLYRTLERNLGVNIGDAVATLTPVIATSELARRLEVQEGAPLLLMDQIAYNRNHEPIIMSAQYHVTGFNSFIVYRTM
jgi:GntR family transcriptional regulator